MQGRVGGDATTGAMQKPAGKQKTNGRGGVQEANRRGVSADKRWQSAKRKRGGGGTT